MIGKVLFVAFHYPPITVSSGVHRTLAFTRYMAEQGWGVSVLTADHKAYPSFDLAQLGSIPDKVKVISAWGKDTARDLAVRGRYFRFMSIPDRYQSWILGGVLSGLKEIRGNRPHVIVSTYPIASAHVVGYLLHRITGIPWVADFRDPMAQEGYPEDPLIHRVFSWIERKAVKHASHLIFVTEGAKEYYLQRYPELASAPDRVQVILNGYDENVFQQIKAAKSTEDQPHPEGEPIDTPPSTTPDGPVITMVHSGLIYPVERNPEYFFSAISELRDEGHIQLHQIDVVLRASGHDEFLLDLAKKHQIEDFISLKAAIPYKEALKEMFDADLLLLLQASNCNDQIPAKAYEYVRVGRPVLALASTAGETGKLMAGFTNTFVAALEDKEEIKSALLAAVKGYHNAKPLPQNEIEAYSRVQGAKQLVSLLENLVSS